MNYCHRSFSPRKATRLALFFAIPLFGSGCVERLLKIRSDPPGADVFVNGKKIVGATPLDYPFSFYGTVGVVLRHERFESKRIPKTLSPPWYEIFPLDFFAEFFVPWTLRDHHTIDARLKPAKQLEEDSEAAILEEQLKSKAAEEREKTIAHMEDEKK